MNIIKFLQESPYFQNDVGRHFLFLQRYFDIDPNTEVTITTDGRPVWSEQLLKPYDFEFADYHTEYIQMVAFAVVAGKFTAGYSKVTNHLIFHPVK